MAGPLAQSAEQLPLYPVVVGTLLLNTQTAAIGSTSLGTFPAGIYRANVSLVLVVAGTSGNLVANIIVTDDSQAETIPAATIAAITSIGQANAAVIIENAASAAINYSTTFSVTKGAASYSLYIVLERIF